MKTPKNQAEMFDVCIVGTGVAGLTIARELLPKGLKVCLIESGGEDYDHDQQNMNDAENIGFDYYKIIDSRLRIYGGTTAIWGGRCAPLDEIDFKKRDWVPYSGWPISLQDLEQPYRKARLMLGLPKYGVQEDEERRKRENFFDMNHYGFEVARWEFDKKHDRFQMENTLDVANHQHSVLMLNSTVTNINVDPETGRTVTSVTVLNRKGEERKVRAKRFVLATGGLENPRLLLNATDYHKNGIGNQNGLVGKFFMEHPRVRGGAIKAKKPLSILKACYRMENVNGVKTVSLVRPTDSFQEKEKVLNDGVTVMAIKPEGTATNLIIQVYNTLRGNLHPSKGNRFLWRNMKNFALWLNRQAEPYISALLVRLGLRELNVIIRAEQAPNPESRVVLSDERDSAGLRRIKLDWRFSELDKESVRRITEKFGRFLEEKGLGSIELASWLHDPEKLWEVDPLIGFHHIGGYHHMGTTRMAETEKTGVVDKNCKVFGIENLYVAGCSVFPTGGWGNPTLTIAALAVRTGQHLYYLAEQDRIKGYDNVTTLEEARQLKTGKTAARG